MPAKRSRKPAPSRGRMPRPRAAASPNGSRGRARSASQRSAAWVQEFSRLLLMERKRLQEELSEMEEHQVKTEEKPVADAANEDDLVDVATEAFEREKELALESSVQGMLEMVEEALKKVRDGAYGICDGCAK